MADFPDVDPGAISDLADGLRGISQSMAFVGQDTQNVRDSVTASEQWQGTASEEWRTVVTDRVGDAGLSNDVMGSAAAMLSGLAADLAAERTAYNSLSGQLYTTRLAPGVAGRLVGGVQVVDPAVAQQMDACVTRATGLLEQAAKQLLGYAVLAGDIHAVPVANRTPGVADGTNRQAASLHLLAVIFGSVVGNRAAGSKFEQAILRALGISKNTEVWRPDPAFEGKLTASGLARGTIPDGQGSNFLVEVKGTSELQLRYQLRLQVEQSGQTGLPLWVIKAAGQKADPSVTRAAEETKGGVLYTADNGKTFTDADGNPVQVTYDKATDQLTVQGYKPVYGPKNAVGGTSDLNSAQPADPGAPPEPVSPGVAEGTAPVTAPEGPELPDIPDPEILP